MYVLGWTEHASKELSALNMIDVYVVSNYSILSIYELVTNW